MRTSIINADKAKKYRIFYKIVAAAVWIMVWQLASMWLKQEILLASPVSVIMRYQVTVHTPLSREVFWHEYAKIPRHTSQNSIAAGNLE